MDSASNEKLDLSFPWSETGARLRIELDRGAVPADDARRCFIRTDDAGLPIAWLHLPPILWGLLDGDDRQPKLERLPSSLGAVAIVLVQAGAASLGLWHDDALLRHRSIRKYVVRGRGKAQPTHLKTKGKSRYGSRLRLRNARSLLQEVNETLRDWWAETDSSPRVFYGCPIRLWSDLLRTRPAPPFAGDATTTKIPFHVHRPCHKELLRIRYRLTHGRFVCHQRSDPNS